MDYERQSDIFKILSHPVRLQILDELRRRQACVCHLQAVTGRPQAYISQQLRLMRETGMVVDEKDGQNVFYRLRDDEIAQLLTQALGESGHPSHPTNCNCPYCSGEIG